MLRTEERTALQELARRELPGLYALAWQLAGPAAEDLVQETLVAACRSYGSLRDPQAAPKWLRVIMTNVWRDGLRRSGREPGEVPLDDDERFSLYRTLADEDPFPYSDTMHVDFLGAFSPRDVQLVLRRLPLRYRAPLVLRYVEGFSTSEVAEILELPLGTVHSQLHRGRQHLERQMWAYAEECGFIDGRPVGDPATTSGATDGDRLVGKAAR